MIGGRSALLSAAGGGNPYGNWTGNYEDVSLLLRGGVSGLALADESQSPKTLQTQGKVRATTTQVRYGASSIYIDGSDYSAITAPGGSDFNFGVGNFTIEAWVYPVSVTTYGFLFGTAGSNTVGTVYLALNPINTAVFQVWTGSSRPGASATGVQQNQWNHIAAVRYGDTFTVFVNGVAGASTTITQSLTSTTVRIGSNADESVNGRFTGYIDDLRVTKGVARYTSNFTPPAAELPANITDDPSYNSVSLLLRGGAPGIVIGDESPTPKEFTVIGSATISTATFKYGGSALLFSGAGRLVLEPSSQFAFGTGDFTIEAWVRPQSTVQYQQIFSTRPDASSYADAISLLLVNGTSVWAYSDTILISGGTLQINAGFYHVALTRQGSSLRLFVNGQQVGSTATNTQNFTKELACVGALINGAEPLNAIIDDLRITKGVARYTKNFLPPPAELPAI